MPRETVAEFPVEVVDARGDPVPRAFVGVLEFEAGQARRDAVAKEKHDLTDFAGHLTRLVDLAQEFRLERYDRSNTYFVRDNRQRVRITKPEDVEMTVEAILYAAVPDTTGRIWFDSVYLPGPQYNRSLQDGDPQTLTVNRAHIGRWSRDSGTTVHAWRTVSTDDVAEQTLCAEIRTFAPSQRGTVSFDLHESIAADHTAVPNLVRTLDPNGRWDRWFNVVGGLEIAYFLGLTDDHDISFISKAESVLGPDHAYSMYDQWGLPLSPKVLDANSRISQDVFAYQPAPYENFAENLPDEELKLAISVLAYFTGITGLGPATVLALLGYYITTTEIAHEFFVRRGPEAATTLSYDDITDRKQALGQFDKNEYDSIPSAWKRTDKRGTWLYVHRVPITQETGTGETTRAALRGAWQIQENVLEALEREFILHETASPLDAGVPER
mgnify:CR=1 FL=1